MRGQATGWGHCFVSLQWFDTVGRVIGLTTSPQMWYLSPKFCCAINCTGWCSVNCGGNGPPVSTIKALQYAYTTHCWIHNTDITCRQHPCSAGCHQLFALRPQRSMFGHLAWSSDPHLLTTLPTRSFTYLIPLVINVTLISNRLIHSSTVSYLLGPRHRWKGTNIAYPSEGWWAEGDGGWK